MTIYCEDDSMAKKNFADRYQIQTSNDFDRTYVVNFLDEDGVTKLCETQTVRRGEAAKEPENMPLKQNRMEGCLFGGHP